MTLNSVRESLRVGHKQVVANDLDLGTEFSRDGLPTGPVVFRQRVFDGNQRVSGNEFRVIRDEFTRTEFAALETVRPVLEELGRSDVKSECDVFAWRETSLSDCAHE
ncbi:unannotated protein [freshwater metagenome]|uniref:Unannotated protein n=1 Tax=freshwater metagenome TaxID=449393 RepID=A0A6J7E7L6_9ZZZZ